MWQLLIALLVIGVVVVGLIWWTRLRGTDSSSGSGSSLYERLGGIYNIALLVDHFSDNLLDNPVVGRSSDNPALREWHRHQLDRLPGLKFQRTLWLAEKAGGPQRYVATTPGKERLGLEAAHCPLQISKQEFAAVAAELEASLDRYKVGAREKQEVLAAFAAHMGEVTACAHNQ
jgi:hemoglobin